MSTWHIPPPPSPPFSSKKWRHLWNRHPLWGEQLWAAGILQPEWSELWRWVTSSPSRKCNMTVTWSSTVILVQIPLHLPACLQSTTPSWWWPTCGLSCRSLRRRTRGCWRGLRTWKRRGTFCAVSWIASSSPQRAKCTNRIRASTVMVRSETGVRWQHSKD